MAIGHEPDSGAWSPLSEELLQVRRQHRICDPAPGLGRAASTELGRDVGRLTWNLATVIAGPNLDLPVACRSARVGRPLAAIVAGPNRVNGKQKDAENAYEKGSQ